jgi:iron complex transport system ATP-binding protein
MMGFQHALSGEVFYGEKQLTKISVKELSRIISVVLTEKIDDFYLTAYEVVMTGRYPYGTLTGKLTEEDTTLVFQAFESVGADGLVDQNFYKLSDGEKQKVMIARAIAQQTPFIFLDEPVAFIDAPSRVGIMQLLDQFCREMHKGILMATHEIESALKYADELWLLGKGGKWYHGPPDEMIRKGFINEVFDSERVSFNKENYRFESTLEDRK